MKKIFLMLISICLSVTVISCSTAKDTNSHTDKVAKSNSNVSNPVNTSDINFGYDFRNGNWGESQSTIEEREGKLLFTAGENPGEFDLLTGETVINGYQVFFSYCFRDDNLKHGMYSIASDTARKTEYFAMFNSWVSYLTDEYGSPSAKGIIPYEQEIPRDSTQTVPAPSVDCEDTRNYAIFETTTSDIILMLEIQNTEANFCILYTDTDYFAGRNGSDSSNTSRVVCDFRNAKWGDTRSDILKYEPALNIVDESDDGIMASGSVSGYDAAIFYFFDDDGKLRSAGYGLAVNYTNPGQYIPVYDLLKDRLSEKYGESEGGIIPLADQMQIDIAGPGRALQFGYVTYLDTWETDTTKIELVMSAEDFDITLMIRYTDKNWKDDTDYGL